VSAEEQGELIAFSLISSASPSPSLCALNDGPSFEGGACQEGLRLPKELDSKASRRSSFSLFTTLPSPSSPSRSYCQLAAAPAVSTPLFTPPFCPRRRSRLDLHRLRGKGGRTDKSRRPLHTFLLHLSKYVFISPRTKTLLHQRRGLEGDSTVGGGRERWKVEVALLALERSSNEPARRGDRWGGGRRGGGESASRGRRSGKS
jgi:hypothetical protein